MRIDSRRVSQQARQTDDSSQYTKSLGDSTREANSRRMSFINSSKMSGVASAAAYVERHRSQAHAQPLLFPATGARQQSTYWTRCKTGFESSEHPYWCSSVDKMI